MTSLSSPSLASLAVLLVEDDPTNQLIALSMLRHLGIEADAASDGRAGVQQSTTRRYDVVLMDIQMPVMDGVEAMKAIRTLHPLGQCPRIVAVTAHAVSGTRERLLAAGFDDFYTKPLSIALLKEAVTMAPPPESGLIVRAPAANHEAQAAEAAKALVDVVRAHVRDMLGEDDEAFVQDLVESFAESSQQAIREVGQARQSRDMDAVARAAHKLKGSACNIGLDTLTERWGQVETGIRSGETANVGTDLDHAVAETERTLALLDSSPA